MPALKNYEGHIFREFKVIEDLGFELPEPLSKQKRHYVIAQCQKCSKNRKVMIEALRLTATKCVCLYNKPRTKEWKRLYKIHFGMISRCYNNNSKDYKKYGAKGIKVCDKWRYSFESFYHWALENNYQENLSIDRIDNSGNYTPENCRWADSKTQMRNRNNVTKLEKIVSIKKLLKMNFTQNDIAEFTNTTYGIVKGVKTGSRWADVKI